MRLTSQAALDLILSEIQQLEPACGTTRVVAIDGPSGAGKTQLAQQLTEQNTEMATDVLHIEDLYPGWTGLEAAVALTKKILASMSTGRVGNAPSWDWNAGRTGADVLVAPTDLLIVEGVTAGARELAPLTNMLVWMDGPVEVRKQRAMARDGQTYAPWWDMWAEQEKRHFAREQTATRADIQLSIGAGPARRHPV